MELLKHIDNLIERAENSIHDKKKKDKVILYAEGLKSKIREADFALNRLTQEIGLANEISEEIHFFNDSFWVFLASCTDVIAQIINISCNLKQDEKQVERKKICAMLQKRQPNSKLTKNFEKLIKSRPYFNADKYRNCCLHRRHIYIELSSTTKKISKGYTTSGPLSIKIWAICDDPLVVKPTVKKNRVIPTYLTENKNKTKELIRKVIDTITF